MAWPCRQLAVAQSAQLPADCLRADRNAEFLPDPLGQVHQTPTDNAMNGRDRPLLHNLHQRSQLPRVQQRARARTMPVDQTIRPMRVEPFHPVAHDLQSDTTNPGGGAARTSIIDRRQCQKAPRLIGITRVPGKAAKIIATEVRPKGECCAHTEHPSARHGESHRHPRRQAPMSHRRRELVLLSSDAKKNRAVTRR